MPKVSKWKLVLYSLVWLIATIYAVGFFMTELKIAQLYRLSNAGTTTTGVVYKKDRENHQRIGYEFSVDGKIYQWGGFSGDIDKEFDEIAIGKSVPVTFETGNPDNSCLGNPKALFYSELMFTVVGSLLPTLALILFGIVQALKTRSRPRRRTHFPVRY